MSSPTVATGTDAPRQPSGTAGRRSAAGFLTGPVGRNLGLIVALAVLCIVGTVTAPDRFLAVDNVLTILRAAAVIGVVSVGMTFVIIGGGIDLSVGANVALSSVGAATRATPAVAAGLPLVLMVR